MKMSVNKSIPTQENQCNVGRENYECKNCTIFAKHRKEIFQNADSIFDAASDLQDFVTKCSKYCLKRVDNRVK